MHFAFHIVCPSFVPLCTWDGKPLRVGNSSHLFSDCTEVPLPALSLQIEQAANKRLRP